MPIQNLLETYNTRMHKNQHMTGSENNEYQLEQRKGLK